MLRLRRVYEPPSNKDGLRILVERLWPRGLSKQKAEIGLWLKEIAPSPELREWFSHDPAKWKSFVEKYWKELERNPAPLAALREKMKEGPVTLVYAARDVEHNGALALKMYLEKK